MATDVDICNLALDELGQTTTIGSLAERTKLGTLCARHYPQMLDELLAAHPWPFARKAIALELTSDTPLPGWEFQYAYPTDCLRAWRVCDEDGLRQSWRELSTYADPLDYRIGLQAVPYEVVSGTQRTCLVTDLEDAYLFYTARVAESRFPPLFTRAAVTALAARLAMPITVAPQLAQGARQEAQVAFLLAAAEGFNESVPDADPCTPSLGVRQ